MAAACKFAESKKNEWQQKMERSLRRNAKTHLTTSHRQPGEQAHTCDPTDRPPGRGGMIQFTRRQAVSLLDRAA